MVPVRAHVPLAALGLAVCVALGGFALVFGLKVYSSGPTEALDVLNALGMRLVMRCVSTLTQPYL